ncbi:hypothetical protein [Mycobacterium sp.]|uniref:phage distal tail protein n=1 Tax=Mycobacterium sp. TaxID=1785 RepID=UPI002623F1ED|nr:hypothetical protein [Mycobacterium sp.]
MALIDGYPGVEATHTINGVAMNVLTAEPRIRLTRVTGLHSLADADDTRQTNTGRRGETVLPGAPRGKTVVYEGTVQARTLAGLRQTAKALRAACRERNAEQRVWLGTDFFMDGRILSFDADDEQTTGPQAVRPFQRDFTLSLRMSDARVYYNQLGAAAAADGDSVVLHNSGDADTDPTLNLTVAAATVQVYNGTLDKYLIFNGLDAHIGGVLVVDFKARTARIGGFDAMTGFDTTGSTWWDEYVPGLAPGDNNVGVVGAAMAASWYPAFE